MTIDQRRQIDVEPLLQWAFRDEIPKKYSSSAEGIWGLIEELGHRGGVDPGHGAAQRYPNFGLPHPDAILIEKAVARLEDCPLDWEAEAEDILGDLFALVERGAPRNRPAESARRVSKIGWGNGPFRVHELVEPPRFVCEVMLRPSALVTMHARMGTRPDWFDAWPTASQVPADRGPYPKIIGECWGKDYYGPIKDSGVLPYCPLDWSPSITSIAEDRADYLAWWRGLRDLSQTLNLSGHIVLPPAAPEWPWRDHEKRPNIIAAPRPLMSRLPLNPQRPTMGPPLRMPRAGKVRSLTT